jgi:outer membrane protein
MHIGVALACGRVSVAFLAASLTSVAAVRAEQGGDTLVDLFRMAEINNPGIASAEAGLRMTGERARQAFGAMLPTLTYLGAASRQDVRSAPPGGAAPAGDTSVQKHDVSLVQPLYSRSTSIQYQIARQQIARQEYDLAQLKLDLKSRVAQAYFLILTYDDTLRLLEAQRNTFVQQLAQARRSYELGIATITDVHEAQSRIDALFAQEVGTAKELEAAKVSLRTLVGKTVRPSRVFEVDFKTTLKKVPALDDLLEQAYAGNYQLRSLNTLAELASLEVVKADVQHLPSIDFKASTSSTKQQITTNGMSYIDSRNVQFGVYVTIPIYTGGVISSRAREAIINQEKVGNDLQSARLGIQEEIEGNHARWTLGIAQIEALEKAIDSSEAALKSVNTGYTLGVRTGLDVFTSQQQVVQLKKDLLKAKYDTLMSVLRTRTALGLDHLDVF